MVWSWLTKKQGASSKGRHDKNEPTTTEEPGTETAADVEHAVDAAALEGPLRRGGGDDSSHSSSSSSSSPAGSSGSIREDDLLAFGQQQQDQQHRRRQVDFNNSYTNIDNASMSIEEQQQLYSQTTNTGAEDESLLLLSAGTSGDGGQHRLLISTKYNRIVAYSVLLLIAALSIANLALVLVATNDPEVAESSQSSGIVAVSAILFVSTIAAVVAFAAFDYQVNRQRAQLLETARRSHAILSSLFPKNVQRELLERQRAEAAAAKAARDAATAKMKRKNSVGQEKKSFLSQRLSFGHHSPRAGGSGIDNNDKNNELTSMSAATMAKKNGNGSNSAATPKIQLRDFLAASGNDEVSADDWLASAPAANNVLHGGNTNSSTNQTSLLSSTTGSRSSRNHNLLFQTKPIADLFPNCTVMVRPF